MKGHRIVLSFFVTMVALWGAAPTVAHAQCADVDYVVLGERVRYNVTAGNAIFLKTKVTAGRSYHVMAWGPFGGGITGADDIDVSVDLFSDATCSTPATVVSTAAFEPVPSVPGHLGAQASIIPATTGPLYVRVRNNGTDADVQAMIVETTLFSPWWFTGGTNQAFIELSNNMDTATTAVVTVRRSDGTVCGTSPVALAGGGNAAIAIKAVGTCDGSGSSQISFNGTPGGISANTTTIDGVQGTSFDSPFVPRMTWSLVAR